jgi:hypothetical protein
VNVQSAERNNATLSAYGSYIFRRALYTFDPSFTSPHFGFLFLRISVACIYFEGREKEEQSTIRPTPHGKPIMMI